MEEKIEIAGKSAIISSIIGEVVKSNLNLKNILIISLIILVIAGFIFSGSTRLVFPLLFIAAILILSMPIGAVIVEIKISQIISKIKNKLDSHLSKIKIS